MLQRCVLLGILLLVACTEPEPTVQTEGAIDQVLAIVGDKTITVKEFKQRSEFAIRPPYCNKSLPIHKKIVLNSLIAEKLLALEAGDDTDYVRSTQVSGFLKGRREQAMRQWLFFQEASRKVVIDTPSLVNVVHLMGRKYKVSYVSIDDLDVALEFRAKLDAGDRSFEDICYGDYNLDSIPAREVRWGPEETELIKDTFFTRELKKDEVLGPIAFADNHHMFMKVSGWTDQPAVTSQQVNRRVNDVTDYYVERRSRERYQDFIREVMRGKQISFNADIFLPLIDILGPYYLQKASDTEAMLKKEYWGAGEKPDFSIDDLHNDLRAIADQTLFEIDGQTWTVEALFQEIASHPLVFRKKTMRNTEFGEQLKLAIVDLVQDKFLTQLAYARGYDRLPVVAHAEDMWRDSMNALYFKYQFLSEAGVDSLFTEDFMAVLDSHVNPYIRDLQKKYNDKIHINTEAFNQIELSDIDMVAFTPHMPFPVVVPGFPINYSDHRLDYGQQLADRPAVGSER